MRYLVGSVGEGAVGKGRREACWGGMREVAYSEGKGWLVREWWGRGGHTFCEELPGGVAFVG